MLSFYSCQNANDIIIRRGAENSDTEMYKLILSGWKCTFTAHFDSEKMNIYIFLLISPAWEWTFIFFWAYECTFTFFWLNFPVWECTFSLSPAHTQAREWAFQPLPCAKIDWKFRGIPLNWSWQHTCSRRMNIYIFPRQRESEHLHLLLRSKIDWKFRVILLNWSWQ